MALPISKEHKQKAREHGDFLFQLSLDGRHLSPEQREANTLKLISSFEITGALPDAAAKELWD